MSDELNVLSKNLGLLSLVSELHPQYEAGRRLGSEGREPPMTLNNITRPKQRRREDPFERLRLKQDEPFFKKDFSLDYLMGKGSPRVETELDPSAVSFRQGYVNGLNEFMSAHGISAISTELFRGLGILSSDDGLVGFVRGARLEAPSIPRNYNPSRGKGILERYLERDEPDYVKEMRFKNMVTQEGFRLGFIVGVAREHDVVLEGLQIPMDNVSYQAFMQGLKGESRSLPLESFKPHSKDLYLIKEESPAVAEMRAYEWIDSQAYHTGLQVWLKSQGIEGVGTWQIRHPEALRAFKAAISGQSLPEYEPKPAKGEFGQDFGIRSILEKHYLPKENLFGDKFKTELSPAEIAHQQGQAAYNLGKIVRVLSK